VCCRRRSVVIFTYLYLTSNVYSNLQCMKNQPQMLLRKSCAVSLWLDVSTFYPQHQMFRRFVFNQCSTSSTSQDFRDICVYLFIHIYTCIYTYIYIYICITHIYIYICIYHTSIFVYFNIFTYITYILHQDDNLPPGSFSRASISWQVPWLSLYCPCNHIRQRLGPDCWDLKPCARLERRWVCRRTK